MLKPPRQYPRVITMAQTKGGSAKTTTAVNFTIDCATRYGLDALLIDSNERQHTATLFSAQRGDTMAMLGLNIGYTAIEMSGEVLRHQIPKLATKHDLIVIDTGGMDSKSLRAALLIAELAVIPCQPRSFDIWGLDDLAPVIADARQFNERLKAVSFISMADPISRDNSETAELLRSRADIVYLECLVTRKKSFANASSLGLSVVELSKDKRGRGVEMPSPDSKAANEIKVLTDRILSA